MPLSVYGLIGAPIIQSISPITVKNGDNLTVLCRVVQSSFGNHYEMIWQAANGGEITNNALNQVTRLSATELQLFVKEVTKTANYLCVVRNNSRILATELVHVYLTNVPSPPRYLKIQSTDVNGRVTITWLAPETDNGSPLTAYYVTIIVEGGNSTVKKIIPDQTSVNYDTECNYNEIINVTVISENACGNSSDISASVDTKDLCGKFIINFIQL